MNLADEPQKFLLSFIVYTHIHIHTYTTHTHNEHKDTHTYTQMYTHLHSDRHTDNTTQTHRGEMLISVTYTCMCVKDLYQSLWQAFYVSF